MSATGAILQRHASAWMTDPLYRGAWFVGPQAGATLLMILLFSWTGAPATPPMPPGWVHPINQNAHIRELATLRNQARNQASAEALLLDRAKSGDAFAQFFMGTLFDPNLDRAEASPERFDEALRWYRKAADQNLPAAQANLGLLLAHERFGRPPDYEEAYNLLTPASATNAVAKRELALLFRGGLGVPADAAKAVSLLRGAADAGDIGAQIILAAAYDRGTDGLLVDHHQAALLYQQAATSGNGVAERELAIHYENGTGLPADPAKAAFWFAQAAKHGDAFAKLKDPDAAKPNPPEPPLITQPPVPGQP